MRKLSLSMIVVLLLVGTVHSTYPTSYAKALSIWMQDNLTYQSEEEEYWKTPQETLVDEGGDCEDFAFLAKEILTRVGYKEAKVIAFNSKTKKDSGHAICVFKEPNGKWSYFDNQYYYKTIYKDFQLMLNVKYGEEFGWVFELYQDKTSDRLFKME